MTKKEKKINKNNVLYILGGLLLIAILIIIIILAFSNNKSQLNKDLEQAGRDYYEKILYNNINYNDKGAYLSKYSEKGIEVTLDSLSILESKKEDFLNKFVNSNTNEKCDVDKTKVVIHPKEPYGAKDYKIDTIIECGFNK